MADPTERELKCFSYGMVFGAILGVATALMYTFL